METRRSAYRGRGTGQARFMTTPAAMTSPGPIGTGSDHSPAADLPINRRTVALAKAVSSLLEENKP